jgi:hypothetical protein
MFHPGDNCWCAALVCNGEGMVLNDYPLFVVLDVLGAFYFGPSFTDQMETYLGLYPEFPEGDTLIEVIPSFTWPENISPMDGIIWYGALTNPAMTAVVGDMGSFAFGWSN